jgi:ATP-dependent exoDNAse (exonuclease V) alpha subunit
MSRRQALAKTAVLLARNTGAELCEDEPVLDSQRNAHFLERRPLQIIRAKGAEVALCVPTRRAAKRLPESTGLEARTIHLLLEADPKTGGFKRGEEHPLGCGLLVVDETSMVDVLLMPALLKALPEQVALLMVGNVDQLSSAEPGQCWRMWSPQE